MGEFDRTLIVHQRFQVAVEYEPRKRRAVTAMRLVIVRSGPPANGVPAGSDQLMCSEQAEGSFPPTAEAGTHIMLLGGEPLPHPTVLWWKFVADSREALTQAVANWNNHHPRFGQEIDLSGSTLKRLVATEAPAGIC